MSCSRTQHSDAGEARTRGPTVSSQALNHWATAPFLLKLEWAIFNILKVNGEIFSFFNFYLKPPLKFPRLNTGILSSWKRTLWALIRLLLIWVHSVCKIGCPGKLAENADDIWIAARGQDIVSWIFSFLSWKSLLKWTYDLYSRTILFKYLNLDDLMWSVKMTWKKLTKNDRLGWKLRPVHLEIRVEICVQLASYLYDVDDAPCTCTFIKNPMRKWPK